MDGSAFFKPESMYAIMARSFPIWYFLSAAQNQSRYIFTFVSWCLGVQCFDCYYLAFRFRWRVLDFLYLTSRSLSQGLVDMFPDLFVGVFLIFQGPGLVSKYLGRCFISTKFFPDIYNSFSITPLGRVASKMKCNFLVFPSPFSSPMWKVASVVFCISGKRTANIHRVQIRFRILFIKGAPADHDVPYSLLTLCARWTYNVHYYRIYKEHRNPGIWKHVKTSCSGTKPFY